jgi:hypothetical protein
MMRVRRYPGPPGSAGRLRGIDVRTRSRGQLNGSRAPLFPAYRGISAKTHGRDGSDALR